MTAHAEAQAHEAESPLGHPNTQLQVRNVEQRLTPEFPQCVSSDVVRRCVQDAETALANRGSLRSRRSWSSEVLVVASWLGQRLRVLSYGMVSAARNLQTRADRCRGSGCPRRRRRSQPPMVD